MNASMSEDLRLGQLPDLRRLRVVDLDALGLLRQVDQSRLRITPVTLRDRVVAGRDEDDAIEEVLRCVSLVCREAVAEALRSPDVAAHTAEGAGVIAKEEVHTVAAGLLPLEQLTQVGPWAEQDVARPADDLRGRDSAGDPIDQEELDVLSGHAASLKVSRRSR